MAVELTDTSANFIGTGISSTYSAPIYANDDDQIKVYVNDVLQTIGDDYVLNGLGSATGVDIVATFPAAAKIFVERDTPIKQEVDTQNNETILEDVIDAGFDKLTMMIQERAGETDRAFLVPKGEAGALVPTATSRAGRLFAFDDTAAAAPVATSFTVSQIAQVLGAIFNPIFTQLASLVMFLAAGVGAIVRSVQDKLGETISFTDFGVSPTATAVQNMARAKLAIAAARTGDRLVLPVGSGAYSFDVSGGLSNAIDVNKRVTIEIIGDVLTTGATGVQANPSCWMNVTVPDVTITGPGRVAGLQASVNDLNAGTDETIPCLIRVAGNNCTIDGLTIVTPPKVGILSYGVNSLKVSGCKFTGGPVVYSDTAHFAMRIVGGARHVITGNRFYPDAGGGMCVQCVFAVSANNCIITSNHAYRPYEKLVYWFGAGNLCADNEIIGNDGTIPGTNTQGTITTVIRFHGSFNRVLNNYAANVAGGVTIYNGQGSEVIDNSFIACSAGGIAIIGNTTNLDFTHVEGNTCVYGGQPGSIVADGIYLACTFASPGKQVTVRNNTVNGFSQDDPILPVPAWQATTAYPKISVVKPTPPNANGRFYIPLNAGGVSGAAEPPWPTTPGAQIVDGSITWVTVAYEAGVQSEIRVLGTGVGNEIANSSINGNNLIGSNRGVRLEYVKDSTVTDNDVSVALHHGREVSCANVRWVNNAFRGAGDKTIVGKSASSRLIYLPAAVQADSAAVDVAGVVTDFNALLAKLRAAGVIDT